MSKGLSSLYHGTKGHIISVASSLPANPNQLLLKGWTETTNQRQATNSNSREFTERLTGIIIRFDKGDPHKKGYKAIDHYHILNPTSKSNNDRYLDKLGNPTRKGHPNSHILPQKR